MSPSPFYIFSTLVSIPASTTNKVLLFENATGKALRLLRVIFYSNTSINPQIFFSIFRGAEKIIPSEGVLYPHTSKVHVDVSEELPSGSRLEIEYTNTTSNDVSLVVILEFEVLG